jgi:hypothetical protein
MFDYQWPDKLGLDDLLADFARKLGKMSAEAHQAYREGVSSSGPDLKTNAELLIEIADELGINTKGKTKDQIADEIVKKIG